MSDFEHCAKVVCNCSITGYLQTNEATVIMGSKNEFDLNPSLIGNQIPVAQPHMEQF